MKEMNEGQAFLNKTNSTLLNTEFYSDKQLILCAFGMSYIPYQIYYLKNQSFGKDSIKIFPLEINSDIRKKITITDNTTPFIKCELISDTLKYQISRSDYYFEKLPLNDYQTKFQILESEKLDPDKYNFISALIPHEYFSEYKLIYFNGCEWKLLENNYAK